MRATLVVIFGTLTLSTQLVPTAVGSGLDKETNQLSPWELHTLSDLFIEVSLLRCPSINQLTARSLKSFLAEKLMDGDGDSEFMDPSFYSVYQNLVRCLEDLDLKPKGDYSTSMDELKKKQEEEEKQTDEHRKIEKKTEALNLQFAQELVNERIKNRAPRRMLTRVVVEQDRPSLFFLILQWLKNVFTKGEFGMPRTKREAEDEEWLIKEKEMKKRKLLATGDFEMALEMFRKISANSCTRKNMDTSFTSKAIKEIATTISLDGIGATAAADFYFVKQGLWSQLRKCVKESEVAITTTTQATE